MTKPTQEQIEAAKEAFKAIYSIRKEEVLRQEGIDLLIDDNDAEVILAALESYKETPKEKAKRENPPLRVDEGGNVVKAVDIEGLKKAKEWEHDGHYISERSQGWNACIDHLAEKGIIG